MIRKEFHNSAYICYAKNSSKDMEYAERTASLIRDCIPTPYDIRKGIKHINQLDLDYDPKYVIVICSMSSANDIEFNKEVERLVGWRCSAIIAFIFDGTPCAERENEKECLPFSLRKMYQFGGCLFVNFSEVYQGYCMERELMEARYIIDELNAKLADRENDIRELNYSLDAIGYKQNTFEIERQISFLEEEKERIRREYMELEMEREEFRKETERTKKQGPGITYTPHCSVRNLFHPIERLNTKGAKTVFASIFAPAEISRDSHMLIQLYLHLAKETETIVELATEAQVSAQRRDYSPLQCKLKIGDKINVTLTISCKEVLKEEKKDLIWMGAFTKCSFDFLIPHKPALDEIYCSALMTIDGYPIGEMKFVTKIVPNPRKLSSKILSKNFKKVFISYSHMDADNVQFVAKAYKALGIKYFFDSDQLEGGDVFEEKIMNNIDSSDLFILCWSDNAAKSSFIPKEIDRALKRAYPQRPIEEATIKMFPISIEPHAKLPNSMADKYHFEVLG